MDSYISADGNVRERLCLIAYCIQAHRSPRGSELTWNVLKWIYMVITWLKSYLEIV